MRFLRLKLENWKNFRDVDVSLQRRVFVTGPNASGKSNLLDALRFLSEIAAAGGGLERACANRGGLPKIRCLSARSNSHVGLEFTIGGGDETSWIYGLVLGQDHKRRPIVFTESVKHGGKYVLKRPDTNDQRDPERLTQTHLEQVSTNREFRAVAGFLSSIRYLHIVPQLVRDPERSLGRTQDPFGGDFVKLVAKVPAKTLAARLEQISTALKAAVPQLQALRLERDSKGTPHLQGLYEHWRSADAWQSEEQFSDGTLRLLGLLWAVLDRQGPLLLEEPELSLHDEVIRQLPQMLARLSRKSGRQLFVSTHSRALLDDSGIAPDEVLVLQPTRQGTEVKRVVEDPAALALLEQGLTLADVVIPGTSPRNPEHLAFFGAA